MGVRIIESKPKDEAPEEEARPEARPKKAKSTKGFNRLMAMGKDRVAVLNSYMIQGTYSYNQMVRLLRDEWGEFRDIDPESVRRMLVRYKTAVIKPKQAVMIAAITGDQGLKDIAVIQRRLMNSIDVVSEMEALIALQTARVRKFHDMEEKDKRPLEAQHKAILLLTEQLVKFANLQMDLGIIHKTPDKVLIGGKVLVEEERQFLKSVELQRNSTGAIASAVKWLAERKALHAGVQAPPAPVYDTEDAEFDEDPVDDAPDEVVQPSAPAAPQVG